MATPNAPHQPVAPLSDPLVPGDLAGWFHRIAGVTRRSWVPLLVIQLLVAAVSAPFGYAFTGLAAAGPPPRSAMTALVPLGMALVLLAGALGQAASVFVVIRDAAGEPFVAADARRFAVTRLLPLLGWGLVAGVLTVFGYLALVLPGLYLTVVFLAALVGVVCVEREGIVRAFTLVNRRLWPTTGRMALVALTGGCYVSASGWVVSVLTAEASLREMLLSYAVNIPLSMALVGVYVVSYAELRFHEQPRTLTPRLADEIRLPGPASTASA